MDQEIRRVAPGKPVFPIVIPTPFAVGDVYCYLIRDEKIVLVDCGHRADTAFDRIKSAFKEQGLSLADLDEIWLTHGHPDHYGQAARLADVSGAVIKGHPKERNNFAGNSDRSLFRDFFEAHEIATSIIDMMLGQLDWLQQYQTPVQPDWITETDRLESGRLNFSIKHAPGHAPGHVVFYDDNGLLFGGDVLLEHISTNALINFDPDSGERNKSLLQYRHSLNWMKRQEGLVLPGHGKQICNISEIAVHHLSEQDKRYRKIQRLLREETRSLPELSEILFRDALKNDAHFLVFSEIIGYLDWGMSEGTIHTENRQNKIIFSSD